MIIVMPPIELWYFSIRDNTDLDNTNYNKYPWELIEFHPMYSAIIELIIANRVNRDRIIGY